MNTGTLYIISAPSGAGKTSLVKQLIAKTDRLTVSVSHTTRQKREGEQHGQDYFFISENDFKGMIVQQAFLEYAQVFDNFYGTAKQSVLDKLSEGLDLILEIDWQGAQQVRNMIPECQSIFILPPGIDELQRRLQSRGQDSAEIITRRMRDAVAEMSHYAEFDYLVVNDDFERALLDLQSIIIANRLRQARQQHNLTGLLPALLQG